MSDIGTLIDFPHPVICDLSPESIGVQANVSTFSTNSSAVWPSANLAIFVPFRIGYIYTAVKMFWQNAVIGSNDVDVGIYDSNGNQLVHSGSTLTSGGSVIQVVSITSTTLEPGLYYLAMVMNGTADTMTRFNNTTIGNLAGFGIFNQASAFPLPSTATFATPTFNYLPIWGVTSNTII